MEKLVQSYFLLFVGYYTLHGTPCIKTQLFLHLNPVYIQTGIVYQLIQKMFCSRRSCKALLFHLELMAFLLRVIFQRFSVLLELMVEQSLYCYKCLVQGFNLILGQCVILVLSTSHRSVMHKYPNFLLVSNAHDLRNESIFLLKMVLCLGIQKPDDILQLVPFVYNWFYNM